MENLVLEVFLHVRNKGYTIYMVGGCVRDKLLHKSSKDIDLVTDMPLDMLESELIQNGWSIKAVGLNFLVTIVSKNGFQFEIANFRKDGVYENGRSPTSVEIGTLHEDAERRDITINALYYCPFDDLILDPNGKGVNDLNDGIIRLIGNPNDRIKEDNLRILRVYRFKNRYNFTIEKNTLKACRKNFSNLLENIPSQRIINEIEMIVGVL